MNASLIALVTVVLSAPLAAQWLNQPTPGIPRTSEGKPNLAAPAPRTPDGKPDLSGLWNKISPKYARNIAADLKPEDIQPWARALVEQRREDLGREYMNVLLHDSFGQILLIGAFLLAGVGFYWMKKTIEIDI